MPTSSRQTNWLVTKRNRGFELGTIEKQIPLVKLALNPEPPDYNTSALNHSASLPFVCFLFLPRVNFTFFVYRTMIHL